MRDLRGTSLHGLPLDYHHVVIVNRLFQVHMKVESYEEGTQVFDLRQNLRTEWDRCNIAFDAGSDCTVVTKGYAARKGCKQLGHQAAYIGFGSTSLAMGDVYEVEIADRLGKVVRLNAIAVPSIYGWPAAKCLRNLRMRFLRACPPPSPRLSHMGEATASVSVWTTGTCRTM